MHLLTTSSTSLEELAEPVDLRQAPADIVALSFTDSDLAGLAAAWKAGAENLPSMRLAALRDLRHPMSVDLWIDSVAAHAKVVLVRILGGYEWWRYGCDQLAALARKKGIRLALLPGECRDEDLRLIEGSTLPRAELEALLGYFREGGPANMRALLRRLAGLARWGSSPKPRSRCRRRGFMQAGHSGSSRRSGWLRQRADRRDVRANSSPVVPILFYRSMLLAADVAPIDALAKALAEKGIAPVPIFVASLKDPASLAFVEQALGRSEPAAIVTATAFAAGAEPGAQTLFDRAGVPVFQVIVATTRRDAWEKSQRGLGPADLAMHVVMPELDGRILAGALSFKGESESDPALGFRAFANRPEPDRVEQLAARIAAFLRLKQTPRAERKLAILIPDYPAAPGRTGYAVGLDVPASVIAMLHDLKSEGYAVDGIPESPRALLDLLERANAKACRWRTMKAGSRSWPPEMQRDAVTGAWGDPQVGERQRRLLPLPRRDLRQRHGRAGARSRALGRPPRRLPRPGAAAAPCAFSLRALAAPKPRLSCAGACRRARHAGVAARQDRGAEQHLLPRDRRRRACPSSIPSSSAIPARPHRPSAASQR